MAYIPDAHKKYCLLQELVKNDYEILIYPYHPYNLEIQLPEGETIHPNDTIKVRSNTVISKSDYSDYITKLNNIIVRLGITDNEMNILGKDILRFKNSIEEINIKENWSILRYMGETTICDEYNLTQNNYYYCVCNKGSKFFGIIDDIFRLCLYSTYSPQSRDRDPTRLHWEIYVDPTKCAALMLKPRGRRSNLF